MMINGKIGFLNYQVLTITTKKKVGKQIGTKFNLKLINLPKTGELVWKFQGVNQTESLLVMMIFILVIVKAQALEEE